MSQSYQYADAAFTSAPGGPNLTKLTLEVGASTIAVPLVSMTHHDGLTTIVFDTVLSPADVTTLDGIVAAHDGQAPVYPPTAFDYWNADPVVTDERSGKSYRASVLLALECQREILNPPGSPIYVPGFVALNPAVGNLNSIHDKLGWHNQQVKQATYHRPLDLLIYYGWPSALNGLGSNEAVAQEMAKYGLIVLGDGLEDPGHGDYSNTQAIINRVKVLKPGCLIFGYVDTTAAAWQTKVDQWNTLGVHGIFFDKAGYDYGTNRADFNTRLDYVHGRSSAKLAFANAWNTDHVLGTTDDASYPNATFNPTLVASKLTQDDWILLESLCVNTTAYAGNGGYASKWDWSARVAKMITLRATFGVNFASAGIVDDATAGGQGLFDFAFVSALMSSMEANGISDTSYGSGSAKAKFWTRQDVAGIGVVWTLSPAVQLDGADSDVYRRFAENARLSLDFSTGAQASAIMKY